MIKYLSLVLFFLIAIPVQYLPESEAQRIKIIEDFVPIINRESSKSILEHTVFRQRLQTEIKMDTNRNGTIEFSRDSIIELKLNPVKGLTGTISSLRNSSTILIETINLNQFTRSYWQNRGDNFKLTLCWNTLAPRTIEIEFDRYPQAFFDNKFIFNSLTFDWQDAINQGFIINYDNSSKTILINISGNNCLDPILRTTTSTSTRGFTRRDSVWNNITSGNWNVVYSTGTDAFIGCLLANVLALQEDSFYGGGFSDNNGSFAMFVPNLTRVLTNTGTGTSGLAGKGHSFDSDCVNRTTVTKTIQGCCTAPAAIHITYNGSHIFSISQSGFSNPSAGIHVCNHSFVSCSTFKIGIAIANNAGTPFQFQGLNVSASQIMLVGYNGTRLKSRIYYANGNQTYGTETLLTLDDIQSKTNFSCLTINSTRVYCVYMTSTGQLKLIKWTGSSWGSSTIIAYPGTSINTMIGISKNNGNNSVAIFRLSGSLFKWNKTHAITEAFIDTGEAFTGAQTTPNYLAVSIRPNATGAVGLMWKNKTASPFNILFQPVHVWKTTAVVIISNPRVIESIFAQQVIQINMTVTNTQGALGLKNLTLRLNQTDLNWIRHPSGSPESFTASNSTVIITISGFKTDVVNGYVITFIIRFNNTMNQGYHYLRDSYAFSNSDVQSNHIFINGNQSSIAFSGDGYMQFYFVKGWFKFFRLPTASAIPADGGSDILLGFEALLILPFLLLVVIVRKKKREKNVGNDIQ